MHVCKLHVTRNLVQIQDVCKCNETRERGMTPRGIELLSLLRLIHHPMIIISDIEAPVICW